MTTDTPSANRFPSASECRDSIIRILLGVRPEDIHPDSATAFMFAEYEEAVRAEVEMHAVADDRERGEWNKAIQNAVHEWETVGERLADAETERDRLRGENERLTAAVRDLLYKHGCWVGPNQDGIGAVGCGYCRTARRLLLPTPSATTDTPSVDAARADVMSAVDDYHTTPGVPTVRNLLAALDAYAAAVRAPETEAR